MRNRQLALVLALVVLPAALAAQGYGVRIRNRSPRAPLPPTAPTVAREMNYVYRRMAFSVESYPMVSVVSAAGFLAEGSTSHWTSYGLGQRLSIRMKPYLFGTLDLTQSPFGGMAQTNTVELGARFLPDIWDHKIHPYADVRVGYMDSYSSYGGIDNQYNDPGIVGIRGSRYAYGFGGIAGAGISTSISRTLMLTVGTSVMQNRMTNHRISEATTGNGPNSYKITSYRYSVGLRWNPLKSIANIPNTPR
jgi:hypothetical protein